jgi:hypothetical protein
MKEKYKNFMQYKEEETKERAERKKIFINHNKYNAKEKNLLFFHTRLLKLGFGEKML